MDRTLKVYAKTGHLFAEINFYYDQPRQVTAQCTEYRRLYNDDEEDESKSVYPGYSRDLYLQYREFSSIDEIKAHDRQLVERELGREMTAPPGDYTYTYPEDIVLHRYVAQNHLGAIGIIDIRFSFINNTKELKFISAAHPRFDYELASNSLESNINCIGKIQLYDLEEPRQISPSHLTRLEPWY